MIKNLTIDHDPHSAYDVLNEAGTADIIFICEHASNYIPPEYHNLGLSDDLLSTHIAWDIGMGQLTRQLSHDLNAPAILAKFSRLLIDANREEDHPTLIPPQSDSITIPRNQHLSRAEIESRKRHYYYPFHKRAAQLIKDKFLPPHALLICGMHSFTPTMNGFSRPWHVGMLWNKDPRLARVLSQKLTLLGYAVGDNEPYSGYDLFFTMNTHGHDHGLPHVTIEIRQDELVDQKGIDKWARILAIALKDIAQDRVITSVKKY